MERRRSSNLVCPGEISPPIEPLNSVSPVNRCPSTIAQIEPAVCPGVSRIPSVSPPISILAPGLASVSAQGMCGRSIGWAMMTVFVLPQASAGSQSAVGDVGPQGGRH
jgi:hypothetical protein